MSRSETDSQAEVVCLRVGLIGAVPDVPGGEGTEAGRRPVVRPRYEGALNRRDGRAASSPHNCPVVSPLDGQVLLLRGGGEPIAARGLLDLAGLGQLG